MLELQPGEELDRLVAEKVMGAVFADGGEWFIDSMGPARRSNDSGFAWELWNPSTDIAQAWEVAEKLRERYGVQINLFQHDRCQCIVGDREFADIADEWADTAAHAICLAALKAVANG